MQINIFSLIAVFLLGFSLTGAMAQEALPSAGGNASGSGGSVSYTVGQVVYTLYTSGNGSVTQGVQQPYEIYVEVESGEADGVDLVCTSYPNPVSDILVLEIRDYQNQYLVYRLYDGNGYLLDSKKIRGNVTAISMGDLASGTYFLKVLKSDQPSFFYGIKTFKIIKN